MTFYQSQPRSGLPMGRILIGVIIAAIGLFSYLRNTSVNPVTGEKQHVALTEDQETALGLQSAPQMAAEMGGEVPSSDPRTLFVQEVGSRIASRSDAARTHYQYNYHLLKDPETINAFALPGGQIFITLGLYTKLPDEASLAGVLGHETGHVVGRHTAEHMAQANLGQSLVLATGVAGSGDQNGNRAAAIAAVVNQMTQLHFSRNDESEADFLGLKYMTQAGYDPRAMLDVMKVLEASSKGNRPPQFLVTHPYPEARYEAIQSFLQKTQLPPNLTRGRSLPQ